MASTLRNLSWPILGLLSLLVPPLGLILLWMRSASRVLTKLVLTVPLLVLTVVYAFVLTPLHFELDGSGMWPVISFYDADAHFDELEEARKEQSAQPVSGPRSIGDGPAESYWTDYRGPNRDGRYSAPILTEWPADGLPLLWRQPVGGGYASFAIAEGRAFTIEQRRQQEVVAAYDLETGRELWTSAWNAYFTEAMGGDGPRATPTWNRSG